MLKFRLIVTVVVVSLLFGCGPSKLEQTVAEGKRNLAAQQERDRIEAEIKGDVAEKRYQQTLIELERQRVAAAEQARLQAEYDYKKSVLDADNRKLELQNQLRTVEIESESEIRKVEIESDKEIRITEMKSQAEIKRHQIQAYERITTERINADVSVEETRLLSKANVEETRLLSMANVEEAKLLSQVGVEKAKMQALIGAVQMRLDSQTKSDEIESAKQIEIAKTIASVEIARVEGTSRIEAEAAVAIVDRISRAKTEQELIEYAATVALFSQQGQPVNLY